MSSTPTRNEVAFALDEAAMVFSGNDKYIVLSDFGHSVELLRRLIWARVKATDFDHP